MNSQFMSNTNRGFAVLGVVVALAIVGSMAAAVSALVAANKKSEARQTFTTQGLYLAQAGMEYGSRNTKALNRLIVPSRQLLGTNLEVTSVPKITGISRLTSLTNHGKSGHIAKNSLSINRLQNSNPCVYLLGTGSGALTIVGTASFSAANCGININSTSSSALSATGTANIDAYYLNIAGGYVTGSNTDINLTNSTGITTGAETFPDPMLDVPSPSYSTCNFTNFSVSGNATIDPGVYCGGLTLTGTGTITMNPGTYIIDGGSFDASGGVQINGTGITIALDGQISGTYATINITGSGTRNLSPPTSGPYNQVLVYQNRSAPSNSNTISGSGGLTINGIIYLPNQLLTFGGNASTNSCPIMVTGQLKLIGTSYMGC